MLTYGYIKPNGEKIQLQNQTHLEYAKRWMEKNIPKDATNELWRKWRIFVWNHRGTASDFVVEVLGWIKVGQYFDGHSNIVVITFNGDDDDDARAEKRASFCDEYEQAGWHIDVLGVPDMDMLEQPPENWFQI